MQYNKKIFILNCKYLPKPDKIRTSLTTCKIRNFVWDSPCNQREMASFGTPHTDLLKCLIYKGKTALSDGLS